MDEMEAYQKSKEAAEHFADLPEDRLRHAMRETITALWSALDGKDGIPVDLHPADLIVRLQRGNIIKDGNW